jgi:Tol biopolymer transport system component
VYYGEPDATAGARASNASADAIESSPNWASATRLLFTSSAGGTADIYAVTLGGTAGLLTGGSFADVEGAWSPDGSKVAFASNRSGDTELYIYTVATGIVTRLTTRTGSDGAPTWLSDGRIVYTCVSGSTFHLCLVDPANPAGWSMITTPYPADHASAVRF